MSWPMWEGALADLERPKLEKVVDLMATMTAELSPDDPPQPIEEVEASILSRPSFRTDRFFIAYEADEPIGYARASWEDRQDNRDRAWGVIQVHPEHRRKSLGSELLDRVKLASAEAERSFYASHLTPGGPGEAFAAAVGAEVEMAREGGVEHREFENRCDLAQLERSMLMSWVSGAAERTAGYSLTFLEGPTPDELMPGFVELMNAMNTAPMPDGMEDFIFTAEELGEWEEQALVGGWTPWTILAIEDATSKAVGLTRVYPNPYRPVFVVQEDTVTLPEHRQKGIGRWMKAEMALRVLDDLPEARWITTWNATRNEAMLGINSAMGFRPHLEYASYRIPTG